MKIYRVSYRFKSGDEHTGYEYFDSIRYAKQVVENCAETHDCEIERIAVNISREGILRALNTYGGHADN